MIKAIVIIIVVLVAGLLLYAATRPDTFRVRRSASINAPPEKVFALLNDFHRWGVWSPWEKMDPSMKRIYSGAANGKGAVYEWEGNRKVGQGRMEITESSPSAGVTIRLDFIKPFEAHNVAEFTLEADGGSTNVTWWMHGHLPYIAKVIHVFFNMDRIVGKDFETGLANLKAVAEQ
jgi:Polyketide cyclase / dehydrase and lipid transport